MLFFGLLENQHASSCICDSKNETFHISKIVNEYDQEIPQSQTADNPVAP